MISLGPALGMGQLHTVASGAEVRLDVTRGARIAALVVDDIGMSDEPRIIRSALGMMARVAIAAGFPGRDGAMTRHTPVFAAIQERVDVDLLGPISGMGHLHAVTRITELLL